MHQKQRDIDAARVAARKGDKTAIHQRREDGAGFSSIANGAFDELAPPPLDRKCNGMLLVFLEVSSC